MEHIGRQNIFDEYTKHDITHVEGMLELLEWVIPDETKSKLTDADWLLIVLSVYLHDLGMLVTRTEYEARSDSNYLKYAEENSQNEDEISDYGQQVASLAPEARDKFLYQEFVRAHHAQRIRGWITGRTNNGLGHDEAVTGELEKLLGNLHATFREDLGVVCESHHLDDLDNVKKYHLDHPYGTSSNESANVQYAAILLRTADLLHISSQRAPSISMMVVNPSNPLSQLEWLKQNTITTVRSKAARDKEGIVRPELPRDTIEVHGRFSNQDAYFGVTRYLKYAEAQLGLCYAWARDSTQLHGTFHAFPWRNIDPSFIEAEGYDASPLRFEIDQERILNLLTGHTLYNDTNVVVRELVQNAIDAVRLQATQDSSLSLSGKVIVHWDPDDRSLTVEDNGTGMTSEIIKENFLKVGTSRYQQKKFLKEFPEFSSISRFGIGVLSAFMVADDVRVFSVHDTEDKAHELTLRSVHGTYLIRELEKRNPEVPEHIRSHGTSVRIRLRPSAELADVEATLRRWIIVPRTEVEFRPKNGDPKSVGFPSIEKALRWDMIRRRVAVEADSGDLETYFGEPIKFVTADVDDSAICVAVSRNKWTRSWIPIGTERVGTRDIDASFHVLPGVCVEGIRVTETSPGFEGNPIWAAANLTGKKAPRTNVARTALEKTGEYQSFLKEVYDHYVHHISDEITRLGEEEGYPITKAMRQVPNMSAGFAPRRGGEVRTDFSNEKMFRDACMGVPAYLIETSESRLALTLHDLKKFEEFASISSEELESLESVMTVISSSSSLANICGVLGVQKDWPKGPRLVDNSRGLLFDLFLEHWSVAEISVDVDMREVRAVWKKAEFFPWVGEESVRGNRKLDFMQERLFANGQLARRANRVVHGLGRGLSSVRVPLEAIKVFSTAPVDILTIFGISILMPSSPYWSVRPANDDVPRNLWAWTLGRVCDMGIATALDAHGGSEREARLAIMERAGVFDVLDQASLRDVIMNHEGQEFDLFQNTMLRPFFGMSGYFA